MQTAANETESKSQTLNTQSSSLKEVRLTYLSSADVALSPVAVSDLKNQLIMNKIQRISIAFFDVNSVKFAYSGGIERILRRHIYVTKCKWKRFNKSDRYPIRENA